LRIFKIFLGFADASKSKKPSRKELKKQQKRNEYEKGLQAMGSKLHNLNEEEQKSPVKKGFFYKI